MKLVAVVGAAVLVLGGSGSLDPSFGHGGRVFGSFSSSDTASGIAVQPDGNVLVSGRVGGKIAVVRFDAQGRLDRTFGRAGLVVEPVGSDPEEGPVRVALQTDGRIVLAGATADLNGDRRLGDGALAVYRLRLDGEPDTSFGTNGSALLRRSVELSQTALAIDHSGRIVLATRFDGQDGGGVLVRRLTSQGRLDPTFGRRGESIARFGAQSFVGSVAVDRQGRVYVAGTGLGLADRFLGVLRLTMRGALDTTFGRRGIARLPRRGALAIPEAVTVQPDGRIVLAGDERFADDGPGCTYCSFLAVGRLMANGRPDPMFGRGGVVVLTRLRLSEAADSLGLGVDRHGRIVVAGGVAKADSGSSYVVARLVGNGTLDHALGGIGYVVTDMSSGKRDLDYATALGFDRDGRIVVAGRSARDELEGGGTSGRIQFRFALARFLT